MRKKYYALALIILATNWMCANAGTTTDVLNGTSIPDSAYTYSITAPSFVEVDKPFYVEITANVNSVKSLSYSGSVGITLSGNGTLTVPPGVTFTDGVALAEVTYSNPSVTSTTTDTFFLVVTDTAKADITGTSSLITGGLPSFTITAPSFIEVDQPFDIQITANFNGTKNLSYSGTPVITLNGNGTITTPASITFTDGVAIASITYSNIAVTSTLTDTFSLSISDSAQTGISGSSSLITGGLPSFTITAPSFIEVDQPFDIQITANFNGTKNLSYSGTPVITLNGNGTITTPASITFTDGVAIASITYSNIAVTSTTTDTFSLNIADSVRTGIVGSSTTITAGIPAFTVSAPNQIELDVPFNITIDVNLNSQPDIAYLNSINVTTNGTGQLTLLSAVAFVNAHAVVPAIYSNSAILAGGTESLTFTVSDSIRPNASGSSSLVSAGLRDFLLSPPGYVDRGVPFTMIITARLFSAPISLYDNPITVSLVSPVAGESLTIQNVGTFTNGVANYILVYENTNLLPGQSKSFQIRVEEFYNSLIYATATVTAPMNPNLAGITVTPSTATRLLAGQTQQYSAMGTYGDGSTADLTSSVTWSSSNTAVATINSTGLATAVGNGTTTITASKNTPTATLTDTALFSMVTFANGMNASVVIGAPNKFMAGLYSTSQSTFANPEGMIFAGTKFIVADYANSRLIGFNSLPSVDGASADFVLGQAGSFVTNTPNNPVMSASSFNYPYDLSTDGTRLAVSDVGNGRILIWKNGIPVTDTAADLVLGAPDFTTAGSYNGASAIAWPKLAAIVGGSIQLWHDLTTAINNQPASVGLSTGSSCNNDIWTDGTKIVVTDACLHGVYIWNSWPVVTGTPADISLGGLGTSATQFNSPMGIASDGTRLFIADTGNNRVLVYNTFPTVSGQAADAVLGQPDFVSGAATSIMPNTMLQPYHVAYDGSHLVVSDTGYNRILVFP